MKVSDVMLSYVYQCGEGEPAEACARTMREEKIGFLPVTDANGKVIGVVTDRDLALRIVAEGRPSSTPVRDVMSNGPLLTARADEELRTLEERMAKQHKGRALVVDPRGVCIGVVSLSDIAMSEDQGRAGHLLREVSRRESVQLVRR